MSRRALGLLFPVLTVACQPSFADDGARVTSPRILAIKSEPAEALPGDSLTYTALIAVPPADAFQAEPVWSFCSAPKPPTEDNAVASACLGGAALLDVGRGLSVQTSLPHDACVLFGPNAASVGARPRDADATGGYYQPLRVDLPGAVPVFHLQRAQCGLAEASADIATRYGAEYRPNSNPRLLPLGVTAADGAVDLGAVTAGARFDLDASWLASDAESYAYFDRAALAVTIRREAMTVTWHASAGSLTAESTGRAEADAETSTTNTWVAPSEAQTVRLWLVLRDSRGGTDFAEYQLTVVP